MTSLLLPGLLLLLLLAWPLYNVMLVSCTLTAGKPIRVAARPAADLRYYWIVIPALNEEKVIANTVESALARGVSGDHDRLRAVAELGAGAHHRRRRPGNRPPPRRLTRSIIAARSARDRPVSAGSASRSGRRERCGVG